MRVPSALAEICRVLASVLGMCAIAIGCRRLGLNATAVSLSFLLLVLVVASQWRLLPAIAASLTATLLFNFFFLPPVGALTIADPQNWIALSAFLITAVIASELSHRAQSQTEAAIEQRREVERLYEISRAVLLDTGDQGPGGSIASQIAGTFELDSVLFYDLAAGKAYRAGPGDLHIPVEEIAAVREAVSFGDGSHAVPVRLGNKNVGVLAVRGAVGKTALDAIANLVAITVERAASLELASRARAARKSEQLKASILDALAHDFKTPLTSIKAASTTLLGSRATPDTHRELLTVIDEETDRLTRLVTEAIQVSHIEAGRVKLLRTPTALHDLVNRVLDGLRPRLDDRAVHVCMADPLPRVMVDADLMALAIRQLIDNALKYSSPGTPIRIDAQRTATAVQLSVTDQGPGLSADEQRRIFEKFYRGESVRNKLPGTGVGLNIVKDILTAHAGTIQVQSSPAAGTTFVIELPAAQEAGA